MLALVSHAVAATWDGPTTGPVRQANKQVIFISQDFKNAGISTAYRGFESAVIELGWKTTLLDGKGDDKTIRAQVAAAIQRHPDAIVLGGIQFDRSYADLAKQARQAKIVLAGWHAAAEPGPTQALLINIATKSDAVANMAVAHAISSSSGPIGVVIFNDKRFAIANAKTANMKKALERCARCKVLAVENMLISNAQNEIPAAVLRLHQTFGRAWTHTLAINDVYFDEITIPLAAIKRTDIQHIAAGDGSNRALSRIKSGRSQQIATVAEPVTMQGWQLADELNRAFAGQAPSGYISRPILVTTPFLKALDVAEIDGDVPYKAAYLAIWRGR